MEQLKEEDDAVDALAAPGQPLLLYASLRRQKLQPLLGDDVQALGEVAFANAVDSSEGFQVQVQRVPSPRALPTVLCDDVLGGELPERAQLSSHCLAYGDEDAEPARENPVDEVADLIRRNLLPRALQQLPRKFELTAPKGGRTGFFEEEFRLCEPRERIWKVFQRVRVREGEFVQAVDALLQIVAVERGKRLEGLSAAFRGPLAEEVVVKEPYALDEVELLLSQSLLKGSNRLVESIESLQR